MTNHYIHHTSQFSKPSSLRFNFQERVAYHDRLWRGREWAQDDRPPFDPFWLYKTEECMAWIVELQRDIESAHRKEFGSLSARTLIWRVSSELANVYRGGWIAEVIASGTLSPDLSKATQDLVFELLTEAEILYSQNSRKKVVGDELRQILLVITDQLLARYKVLIDALPSEFRDEVWRGARARCEA